MNKTIPPRGGAYTVTGRERELRRDDTKPAPGEAAPAAPREPAPRKTKPSRKR